MGKGKSMWFPINHFTKGKTGFTGIVMKAISHREYTFAD
jgi:hypothetical protein